jgi:hypothetical protein
MKSTPFDRDAIPLSPLKGRKLLQDGGFKVLRTDFMFIFPRSMKALRKLEPFLCRMPIGAQSQILGRKPL